jgi:inosose dehydratase
MTSNEQGRVAMPAPRAFGVDLITFFGPRFWGLDSADLFRSEVTTEPRRFWDSTLDALGEAGISEFEMTFSPADPASALVAYGSADAFKRELDRRDLRVVSCYFGAIEAAADVEDPGVREQILRQARDDAEFLGAVGAKYLVAGLPMRKNGPESLALAPVTIHTATPIADLLNEVGAATLQYGVTLALHTESHSVFWTPRDIDLFLLLTDPFLVAFCPDTGHIVLGGGDPVEVVSRHRDRVVIAHWKDAIGPFREAVLVDENVFAAHRPYFRPAGKGIVDWHAWARLLHTIGFSGGVLLELDAADDPVAQLVDAREYLEHVIRDVL